MRVTRKRSESSGASCIACRRMSGRAMVPPAQSPIPSTHTRSPSRNPLLAPVLTGKGLLAPPSHRFTRSSRLCVHIIASDMPVPTSDAPVLSFQTCVPTLCSSSDDVGIQRDVAHSQQVHAGQKPDPITRAIATPIFASTAFAFKDAQVSRQGSLSLSSRHHAHLQCPPAACGRPLHLPDARLSLLASCKPDEQCARGADREAGGRCRRCRGGEWSGSYGELTRDAERRAQLTEDHA